MDAENVKVTQSEDGNHVMLDIDLTQGEANEKGSTRVATSHGWRELVPGFRYSLNVFTSDKIKAKSAEAGELERLRQQVAELQARAGTDGATGQTAAEIAAMPGAKRTRAPKAA